MPSQDHETGGAQAIPPEATENLVFRESPIHGLGAFAKRPIVRGARVIEYVGERISKEASLRQCEMNNPFIFSLGELHDLNGNVSWNPARFINHSCEPNCEAELIEERVWLVAARDIAPGEEITFNYGYDLADYRDYPCACGKPGCVGFIVAEEFFDSVAKAKRRHD